MFPVFTTDRAINNLIFTVIEITEEGLLCNLKMNTLKPINAKKNHAHSFDINSDKVSNYIDPEYSSLTG